MTRAAGSGWDALFIAEVVQPLGLTGTDWTAGTALHGSARDPSLDARRGAL